MKTYVREILSGAASLVSGLGVTLQALLSRPVTVPYPRKKIAMQPGYRGHPVLTRDPATGILRCIACGTCSRMCPSRCISVTGTQRNGERRKSPQTFVLDFSRCSLCGTCVEVCPVSGLAFSHTCGMAVRSRAACVLDLVKLAEESSCTNTVCLQK